MKSAFKNILPYLLSTATVVAAWRILTLTDSYAWSPKGKERLMLDIALWSILVYKAIFWSVIANAGLFAFIQFINKRDKQALFSTLIAVTLFFTLRPIVNKKCAFDYYKVFCYQSVSEEYIERPILEAGYYIGPYLTGHVKDTASRYRRYAIRGLGRIKYEPSIPFLANLLRDRSEKDYLRADAFVALKMMNSDLSGNIVDTYQKSVADNSDKNVLSLANLFLESK